VRPLLAVGKSMNDKINLLSEIVHMRF
jgi:hypothetical protein